jgi:hypothetical protein
MKCKICELWGIDRDATHIGTWNDGSPLGTCKADMGAGIDMRPIPEEDATVPNTYRVFDD